MSDKLKKLAICWIGIGGYTRYFRPFYDSFNEKFCPEEERTFFVFTSDPSISKDLPNCLTYDVSHACTHPGFVLFRKFKYLMMAEDKFLDYDYVIFCNGNMRCQNDISFDEIDPGEYDLSGIQHPVDRPDMVRMSGSFYDGSSAHVFFNDWCYLQAGFFVAHARFFLKLANGVEHLRCLDKMNGAISHIPWHDECYYNSLLSAGLGTIRVLPYMTYNCPDSDDIYRYGFKTHPQQRRSEMKIVLDQSHGSIKGRYAQFKDDLY